MASFRCRFISGKRTILEGVMLACSAAREGLDAQWEEAHRRFIAEMTKVPVQADGSLIDENALLAEALRLAHSQDRS